MRLGDKATEIISIKDQKTDFNCFYETLSKQKEALLAHRGVQSNAYMRH